MVADGKEKGGRDGGQAVGVLWTSTSMWAVSPRGRWGRTLEVMVEPDEAAGAS